VDILHRAGTWDPAAGTLLRIIFYSLIPDGFSQRRFRVKQYFKRVQPAGIFHVNPLQSLSMNQAVVITVSDSCSRGEREDLSGPAVAQELETHGFDVVARISVPDERKGIEDALRSAARQARLVVTTGGTGIAPRDVTPEATKAVCDRLLDGVAQMMRAEGRKSTLRAVLSRGVCGTIDESQTLVLNVPGSPAGAVTSLRIVMPVLDHALALLAGETAHEEDEDGEDQD
jgi:molybdopterin adenylyltransferase